LATCPQYSTRLIRTRKVNCYHRCGHTTNDPRLLSGWTCGNKLLILLAFEEAKDSFDGCRTPSRSRDHIDERGGKGIRGARKSLHRPGLKFKLDAVRGKQRHPETGERGLF